MEEQLAEVVEACRFRLARGESVEQCLADYPDHAEELRSLLPVMARLPALRRDPDAAFLHSARQRFHARLAEARAGQRSPGGRAGAFGWLRRLAVPVGAAAVFLASGAGLVTASAEALPGQPLYTVQQVQEHVTGYLARTPEQQALHHLTIANQRLRQLQKAQATAAPPLVIDELTAGMVQQTTLATQQLSQVPPAQRRQLSARLGTVLAEEDRALQREEATAPPRVAANATRRRQQLAADRARLQGDPPGAASRSTVTAAQSEAPIVPPASQTPQAERVPAGIPRPAGTAGGASSDRSAPHAPPSPRATRPPRPGAPHPLTAAERLRRFLDQRALRQSTPQAVHSPQP